MAVHKAMDVLDQDITDLDALPQVDEEIIVVEMDPELGESVIEEILAPQVEFDDNLAEFMDETDLSIIAADLVEEYEADEASRADWIQTYIKGLDLLGLKIEDRTAPWDGACGVHHPLLTEALVKFQSETMMATFPAQGPVRTVIVGKETPEKKRAAARVQTDMNHELMEHMVEFRSEHERMLWGLGLSGNGFKKVYYDIDKGRAVSMYVPAEDIVVPYGVSNLSSSPRITHIMRKTKNELLKLQYAGFYRDIELGEPAVTISDVEKRIAQTQGLEATEDDRYRVLEMHVELDLPGFEHTDEMGRFTGIALPYVVTVDKGSATVLSIRRNWLEGDSDYKARQHFVHYGYVPGFGFYNLGLVHLVGAFADSGTSLLRQLVDSGTLANLPAGFKTRAMRIRGDDTPIAPGEFKDVDVPAGTIKDNILPLPYKEPSQTLLMLMNQIVEEGRRFANTADLQISDMSSQAPVGTTLAILERTLKTMTAVQARVHYAMKQELGLLKALISESAPGEYHYEPDTDVAEARRSDYENVDVIPVSDPNASTMAQRITQYQAVLQLAQSAPQMYNMPLLHRQMLDVLDITNADKLVPMDEDMKPTDPISENQNILMGKPVKAHDYQDHEAHIAVHMSAMQDPQVQQLLAGNPAAQVMQAAMMEHINEHLGMKYRREIEMELGFALPARTDESGEEIGLDPDVEARLAPLMAQAAQRLLAKNQAQQAQQEAQQQAQDPLFQMQQQEVAIKEQEVQRKAQKDAMDAQFKQQQQQLEAAKMLAKNELEREKINADRRYDAVKTAASMRNDRDNQMIQAGVDALSQISAQNTRNRGGV